MAGSDRDGGDGRGGAKAGWILLGTAALLAAGSVAYNMLEDAPAQDLVADADVEPGIAELRAAAEASSGDAQPWSNLAFAHFNRGEFGLAASAYERAVAIDEDEPVLWSALGESLVYASERDPLPPNALAAFERALELDPGDPRARYFLAVKRDLGGDHEGAIGEWLALLEDSPVGAPWEADLVRTIQQVGAINDIDVEPRLAKLQAERVPEVALPGSGAVAGTGASPALRGPSAQQVAEASRMTPGEQRAMAEGMVSRLEARLVEEPGNLDGWLMLIRSRMTLGETGKARDALTAAIAANPGEAEQLRAQAQRLGIR